jgi:nucleoside-diphosphate-sugar epimerase
MVVTTINNPAIPAGDLILITGVNGFIASHVANQCLAAGYRVRGTTRDTNKNAWISTFFSAKYGPGNFELVKVENMTDDGAFDQSVQGCAGVVHLASNMTSSTNYDEVVGDAVDGALGALKSAATQNSVKRFVFTSSSTAATLPKPEKEFTIYKDSWDDEAIKLAQGSEPDGFTVYAARKTLAEKEVWKWVEENKPSFVVNAGVSMPLIR